MGTGVTSLPSSLHFDMDVMLKNIRVYVERIVLSKLDKRFIELCNKMWLSPRPISIRQLHVSPHFHLEPIYLIVFQGSYLLA